jgi:leucyl-tRNA synthetase
LTRDEMITIPVQVNGKVRDRLQVEAGAAEEAVREMALRSEAVAKHLDGKAPKKVIYVPSKLVSIVV